MSNWSSVVRDKVEAYVVNSMQEERKIELLDNLSIAVEKVQNASDRSPTSTLTGGESLRTLCDSLSDILHHGLKEKLAPTAKGKISFWPVIERVSLKEDIQTIYRMPIVQSESNRCQVWIRMALKEHTIGSYLNMLLEESKLRRDCYHHYAFLRDTVKVESVKTLFQYVISTMEFDIDIANIDEDLKGFRDSPESPLGLAAIREVSPAQQQKQHSRRKHSKKRSKPGPSKIVHIGDELSTPETLSGRSSLSSQSSLAMTNSDTGSQSHLPLAPDSNTSKSLAGKGAIVILSKDNEMGDVDQPPPPDSTATRRSSSVEDTQPDRVEVLGPNEDKSVFGESSALNASCNILGSSFHGIVQEEGKQGLRGTLPTLKEAFVETTTTASSISSLTSQGNGESHVQFSKSNQDMECERTRIPKYRSIVPSSNSAFSVYKDTIAVERGVNDESQAKPDRSINIVPSSRNIVGDNNESTMAAVAIDTPPSHPALLPNDTNNGVRSKAVDLHTTLDVKGHSTTNEDSAPNSTDLCCIGSEDLSTHDGVSVLMPDLGSRRERSDPADVYIGVDEGVGHDVAKEKGMVTSTHQAVLHPSILDIASRGKDEANGMQSSALGINEETLIQKQNNAKDNPEHASSLAELVSTNITSTSFQETKERDAAVNESSLAFNRNAEDVKASVEGQKKERTKSKTFTRRHGVPPQRALDYDFFEPEQIGAGAVIDAHVSSDSANFPIAGNAQPRFAGAAAYVSSGISPKEDFVAPRKYSEDNGGSEFTETRGKQTSLASSVEYVDRMKRDRGLSFRSRSLGQGPAIPTTSTPKSVQSTTSKSGSFSARSLENHLFGGLKRFSSLDSQRSSFDPNQLFMDEPSQYTSDSDSDSYSLLSNETSRENEKERVRGLLADLGISDDILGLKEDHFATPESFMGFTSKEELEHAIASCKRLIKELDDSSPDRQELIDKLVILRIKLQDVADQHVGQGARGKRILGHHFAKEEKSTGNHFCDHCGSAIWELFQTFYRCKDCSFRCHKKCLQSVDKPCVSQKIAETTCITDICPESGLSAQQYRCADCRRRLSHKDGQFESRLCDYTGQLYCNNCHWNEVIEVPARIVHNWDFTPRKVSRQSKHLLNIMVKKPIICVKETNPALFNFVEELRDVRILREQILVMKTYLTSCRVASEKRILLLLKHRQHFVENSDIYSLRDLIDINSGWLLEELARIHSIFASHIKFDCILCQGKAFLCEICKSKESIFPFDYSSVSCQECNATFHRHCFSKDKCPKCRRIAERRDSMSTT